MNFDDEWVRNRQREEFTMLIRRAVADRRVTPQEHRQIDLARTLIGLTEPDAEQVLHDVVAEAESFFGGTIEGKD